MATNPFFMGRRSGDRFNDFVTGAPGPTFNNPYPDLAARMDEGYDSELGLRSSAAERNFQLLLTPQATAAREAMRPGIFADPAAAHMFRMREGGTPTEQGYQDWLIQNNRNVADPHAVGAYLSELGYDYRSPRSGLGMAGGLLGGMFGYDSVLGKLGATADRGDLGYKAAEAGYGPYVAGLGIGGLAAAGAGTLGAGAGEALGGSAAFIPAEGAGGIAALGETALPAAGGGLGTAGAATAGGGMSVGSAAEQAYLSEILGQQAGVVGNALTPGAAGSFGAGAVAGGTALSRIIDGTASAGDWAQILGTGAGMGLDFLSGNRQADILRNELNRNRAERAPFLGAATNWLNNPQSYIEGPGQAAMKGTLSGLSAKFGNPIGSGTALALANEAGLRDWRDAVTGFGNMGLSGADTRANLATGRAGAVGNIYGGIAEGIGDIVNPRSSLADLMRQYKLVLA